MINNQFWGHYECNVVEIKMKSLYYGTCGKQAYFREMYMGNPGY